MDEINVNSYFFDGVYLNIIYQSMDLSDDIELVLKNRKKGTDLILKTINEKTSELMHLKASLKALQVINDEREIFDLYITYQGSQRRLRLLDNNKIEQFKRASNYTYIFENVALTPYITEGGFCSILKGELVSIWRESYKTINHNLTANVVKVEHDKLILSFSGNKIDSDHVYFIADKRKFQKHIRLNIIEIKKSDQETIVQLELLGNHLEFGRYDIKMIKKCGRIIEEYRIGVVNTYLANKKNNRYFKSYEVEGMHILMYITVNGGVSFYCDTLLGVESEQFDRKIETELFYEQVEKKDHELRVKLKGDILQFVNQEDVTVWLIGKKESYLLENTFKGDYLYLDTNVLTKHLTAERKFEILICLKNIETRVINEIFNIEDLEDDQHVVVVSKIKYASPWIGSEKEQFLKISEAENFVLYLDCGAKGFIFKTASLLKYSEIVTPTVDSCFDIINLEQKGDKLAFNLLHPNYSAEQFKIHAIERNSKERLDICFVDEESKIIISFYKIITLLSFNKSRWDIIGELNHGSFIEKGPLGIFQNKIASKKNRYFDAILPPEEMALNMLEEDNILIPFFTNRNALAFVIRDKKFVFKEKYEYSTMIHNVSLNRGILICEFSFSTKEPIVFSVGSIILKLRSKTINEVHELPVEILARDDAKQVCKVSIDLSKLTLQQFYYDFFFNVNIEEDQILVRLENAPKELISRINESVIKNSWQSAKTNAVLYPYITPKGVLFLAYRERSNDESKLDAIKEIIAYPIYKMFKSYFDKKNVWLVYEKNSETAQDNSYYFFKYCYENKPKQNVYFIIKKNSPDINNLKGMENRVLQFMSIKHLLYLMAAKLLIASETRGHAYIWRHQKGKIKDILNKKQFVFLQHGVTALKLNDSILSKSSPSAATMYVTTSDFERDIIMNGLGYKKEDIIVSGFPRWDVLQDRSKQLDNKEIFIMPTWRGWLDEVSEEKFVQMDYYKHYMELLNSQQLAKVLEEKNVTLKFFLHPKFKQYIHNFTVNSPFIHLIQFGEEKVNDLLMNASLLITDYSSVAWEMYYMKKPVIFYQFDFEDYNMLTGSYIDMNEGLFGERVFTVDQLILTVEQAIRNNFSENELYVKDRSKHFAFIDQNNCKRVYKGIVKSTVIKK